MADKLTLELVSPEKLVVSAEVDDILAQGVEGEFGLLPGHSPFVTELSCGGFMYRIGNDVHGYMLEKGFLKIADDKVVVLAVNPERCADINIEEAKASKEQAEKVMKENNDPNSELFIIATRDILYHQMRIEIYEKFNR